MECVYYVLLDIVIKKRLLYLGKNKFPLPLIFLPSFFSFCFHFRGRPVGREGKSRSGSISSGSFKNGIGTVLEERNISSARPAAGSRKERRRWRVFSGV